MPQGKGLISTSDKVSKKIREARFFLDRMIEREALAFGDHEQFDFLLSAFLSASRSIDYRMRCEEGDAYRVFRDQWDAHLSAGERELIKFLVDDRNREVHRSGSTRAQHHVEIPLHGTYRDRSGTAQVWGPPMALTGEQVAAAIMKPAYFFEVEGRRVQVVERCEAYLRLLERMVFEYANSRGIP